MWSVPRSQPDTCGKNTAVPALQLRQRCGSVLHGGGNAATPEAVQQPMKAIP